MKIYLLIILIIISGLLLNLNAQPLQHRILIACSYDGLNFQKLNIVLCDSADVPDAIVSPSGIIYVYYQGLITPCIDGIKVAISNTGLDNWQHYQVNIPNTNWPGKPCDPDVLMFGDTFRLYFTGDSINDGYPETYSAISFDGINFIRETGVRFEVTGQPVLDPSLLWTQDTLQYFAGGAPDGYNWHAHSTNGLFFTQQPNFSINNLMMANGISVNTGGYRFYCFSNHPSNRNISSIFSNNGENWTVEPGYRLLYDSTNPLEYLYVKDPAIVYKDSIYLMYYVTKKRTVGLHHPDDFIPEQSFSITPNPFTKRTKIKYRGCFHLIIYDLAGNAQKTIIGKDEIIWSGTNDHNQKLKSGIYFGVFQSNNIKQRIKLILY
ncbi:MAG: hypothetical protein N2748_05045 [candidate division WOR-3 bacterium]|nr:hypothetical protein [candidate division WOR-3 bacterium]